MSSTLFGPALLCGALGLVVACGGKAVIDGAPEGGAGGAGAGGIGGEGGSPATGDPNCLALCGQESFACQGNSGASGVLSYGDPTSTGCTWTFTTAGQAPVTQTIDCQQFCMLEDGVCYILTWSVPGDPVAMALVFANSLDVWGCSPVDP